MKTLSSLGYAENYYHTLNPDDEKPVVVHHVTAQCTLVLSGSGTVILDGDRYRIHENSIILVDAGVTHQFLAETALTLFHIHIPFETEYTDRDIISGDDFILHLS